MPFYRYLIAKTRGGDYLVDVSPSFALLRISRGWALTCLQEFLLKFAAKATRRWLFKLKCPFFLVSWCCFLPQWWWMPQQKNTSLKKTLGIPKHPKCPPTQKNCMALGKQENIMEVNVICHIITLARTFQGLICCHLLATQLENGNRQKIQRFNMLFHGKKHVTSGFSDHFSRNRRCHSPRLV